MRLSIFCHLMSWAISIAESFFSLLKCFLIYIDPVAIGIIPYIDLIAFGIIPWQNNFNQVRRNHWPTHSHLQGRCYQIKHKTGICYQIKHKTVIVTEINHVGPFKQVFHRGEGSFWPCNAFSTPSSIELRACVQTHTNSKWSKKIVKLGGGLYWQGCNQHNGLCHTLKYQ